MGFATGALSLVLVAGAIFILCLLAYGARRRLRASVPANPTVVSPRTLEALRYNYQARTGQDLALRQWQLAGTTQGAVTRLPEQAVEGEQLPSYQAAGRDPKVDLPSFPIAQSAGVGGVSRPEQAVVRNAERPPEYEPQGMGTTRGW